MESYLFESSIALETTYDSSAGRERREGERDGERQQIPVGRINFESIRQLLE